MCMEDIRIGRRTKTVCHRTTIDVNPVIMVDGNPNRVILILSASDSDQYSISPNPNEPDFEGLVIPAAGDPVRLTLANAGDFITKPLYAKTGSGPQQIGWIEGTLDDQ